MIQLKKKTKLSQVRTPVSSRVSSRCHGFSGLYKPDLMVRSGKFFCETSCSGNVDCFFLSG